jgi:hypothetical protein
MRITVLLFLSLMFVSCDSGVSKIEDLRDSSTLHQEAPTEFDTPQNETPSSTEKGSFEKPSKWSYKVISISENNWGYQLFDGPTMVINQTAIPSVQGIDGFDSHDKAERTAKFIVQKLERGIFPPTVDKNELDSLGVLRN